MLNQWMNQLSSVLVSAGNDLLMPTMAIVFVGAAFARLLLYYTVRQESIMTREFEKRVQKHLVNAAAGEAEIKTDSFFKTVSHLLSKTYYEVFEKRRKYKRRRLDQVGSAKDRLFMTEDGITRLIGDTLKQIRYFKRDGSSPNFELLSRHVFSTNPIFSRLAGILPVNLVHDILNLIPGLLIIGGIFGTFLGIMQGLPGLGNMDLANVDLSKKTMDEFLVKIAFSMGTSIVGIFLSVILTVLNTVFAPENVFYQVVNQFSANLEFLWKATTTNETESSESAEESTKFLAAQGDGTSIDIRKLSKSMDPLKKDSKRE